MPHVDTHNAHATLRVSTRRLSRHLEGMLSALGRPDAVVDVQLVDDNTIAELNAEWRGIEGVTDVISFALEDDDEGPTLPPEAVGIQLLGDIIISLNTADRQAAEMRVFLRRLGISARYSLWQETCFLATHGLLHLLGYDHQDIEQAEVMEAEERRFIAAVTSAPVHDLDRTAHGQ